MRREQGIDTNLIAILLIVTLLVSAPFIYRFFSVIEAYVYSDVRQQAVGSVFFVREKFGLTVGDLTIKDIQLDDSNYIFTVHEHYHGFIDEALYDDLVRDYVVRYDRRAKNYSIEGIIELS